MSLNGTCNRCGRCCVLGEFRCNHLIGGKVGVFTGCAVYDLRWTDMPITLTAPDGQTMEGFCLHNSAAEDDSLKALIKLGLCSLEE